jgi:metal-responsive CopG/Arc/MetJ family transcriptional regulator
MGVYTYTLKGGKMSKMEKATLTMPGELKREARAKAIREGRNLSEVVRELLAEYLKQDPPKQEQKP